MQRHSYVTTVFDSWTLPENLQAITCDSHGMVSGEGWAFEDSKPRIDQQRLFSEKVAPALSAKCVSCHRPDNLKGGLDISTWPSLLKGGDNGPVLAIGKSKESPLYNRSVSVDGSKPEMPEKGEPLTTEEAEAIQQWIDQGANWPEGFVLHEKAKGDKDFWFFLPLAQHTPPTHGDVDPVWQKNPIDCFILDKLRANGLKPNTSCTPREFVRRAYYDLLGLPPTPDQFKEFIQECDAIGYDEAVVRLVDRLLDSPHYGEQWGRHWLDVIRFGESRGYERNEIITNLWPFRDYVIKSFNDDKPFDQFIIEHLAGDVIGKDQPEVEIGSAFLVAGPMTMSEIRILLLLRKFERTKLMR